MGTAYVVHWRNLVSKIYKGALLDITDHAFFTLSSGILNLAKGHDVHHLLDENIDHYWRSDGETPHVITIEFPKKEDFLFLLLYLDYELDEQHTPQEALTFLGHFMCSVVVYLGPSAVDVNEFRTFTFFKPDGWQVIFFSYFVP
ncbi:unnamed protein product [Gongylonema pulchrum]|uniref:Anaphase-promoting complex subunit 10 n=1 Tax=Gongylonema pulchrum TaxID=637853 RepID=A0A183EW74_9BILA|nr:unnamed protein product [Gongylonema pulchrum]